MAKKVTSAKRVGRNANRPANKRYKSENRAVKNRDRRVRRVAKNLAVAAEARERREALLQTQALEELAAAFATPAVQGGECVEVVN